MLSLKTPWSFSCTHTHSHNQPLVRITQTHWGSFPLSSTNLKCYKLESLLWRQQRNQALTECSGCLVTSALAWPGGVSTCVVIRPPPSLRLLPALNPDTPGYLTYTGCWVSVPSTIMILCLIELRRRDIGWRGNNWKMYNENALCTHKQYFTPFIWF